jgi:hypothetical protein
MLKRACLFSILLILAIAGTYWYFLRDAMPPVAAVFVSLFLAFFASAGIGIIRTSLQARKTKRLFADAEAGVPLQDGKKIIVTGRINPQGFPAKTPFQQKECVLYEYEIKFTGDNVDENTACDFVGMKMVQCSIHSSRGNVRLIGFPHLDHLSHEFVKEPEAQETARQFVQATKFEKGSLLSVGSMISGLMDAWRDEDGIVQKDWRITKDENFKEGSVLKEKYISPGDSVAVIGVYSAAQNGLIAPKDDSIDIVRGDLRDAREAFIQKKANLGMGILFFLVAQFFFGVLYFFTEKREAFLSPQEQSASLHQAVSSQDYKLLEKLRRNGVSFDLKDSYGRTPLMGTSDASMTRYLLENGANVNAVDPETDETVIFNAAKNGQEELLRLYIKHGADVHAISKIPWQHSPIHSAIESGQPNLVSILMENGARDDRVNSMTGRPVTEGSEQFQIIQKYHAAIQEQNLEELKNLTTARSPKFFEEVDFNVWKYYYPAEMDLIEGFANDSAATVTIQTITPQHTSQRWVYQLVRNGSEWKIARVWETRDY